MSFLNSNFVIALVTFLAGTAAFIIYIKQKWDSKKDAANIILLEIQNAERILGQVGEGVRTGQLQNKFLIPTESWNKYKYLFVRDFDRDEWDNINGFYNNCQLYDEAIAYNNSFFQKNEEQIRINITRTTAEYLKTYLENGDTSSDEEIQKLDAKIGQFQKTFLSKSSVFYSPVKPLQDAKIVFENISKNISQTSIGLKLKKLAKIK